MRIKLNCLACGHPMELGEAYEDYQGEVRCWGCRALVEVMLHEGKLQSMRLSNGSNGEAESHQVDSGSAETPPPQPPGVETVSPASM